MAAEVDLLETDEVSPPLTALYIGSVLSSVPLLGFCPGPRD